MRALALAAASLASLAACVSEATLELPDVSGARTWIVVVTGDDHAPYAEVVAPTDAFRVRAAPGARVELLAFRRDLALPIGPLEEPTGGFPLPDPAATFVAAADGAAWSEAEPSAEALALRVPSYDDCQRYTVKTEVVSTMNDDGVVGIVKVGKGRFAVFARDSWVIAARDSSRAITPLVPGVLAATADPAQAVWVATRDALWAIYGDDPFTATASRTWSLPPDLDTTFSLAIPQPGRVYGLTTRGVLYVTDREGTKVLFTFDASDAGPRGQVFPDRQGVLAAFGENPLVVRVNENDVVTRITLPTLGEGAVSIASFAEYGIVVGTSKGYLRAQRDAFEPIVDKLGNVIGDVSLRMLEPLDDRLYFGGNTGLFGHLSPQRHLCVADQVASSSVRFVASAGGQLLVGGRPPPSAGTQVHLTRFTPTDD